MELQCSLQMDFLAEKDWAHDSPDESIHLEDGDLFYCTYVCLFFKVTLLLITRPVSAPPSYEIDRKCPRTVCGHQ